MKKIMIATDGSQMAQSAAEFLARLPHQDKIELTIATVLFVPVRSEYYSVGDWEELCRSRDKQRIEEAVKDVKAVFEGANVQINHIYREGHPGKAIVEIAKEVQPELVVMGATGHSAISRMLLGSTSDYVATHAPCSVLIVRPTTVMEGKRPLRVVIGYEQAGPAQAALKEFVEFDWGPDTDVELVTVHYGQGFYQDPDDDRSLASVRDAADQIRDVAPRASGTVLDSENFGESMLEFIEKSNTDLVVLGETQRTRMGRVLLGGMTRLVLRHAPCSVWITRNRMISGLHKDHAQTSSAASTT